VTGDANKMRLLIVDDNVEFLGMISSRLEVRDFDVTTASSGEEALKVAKRGKFDLAILDLKMPGLDGMKALEVLKSRHKYLEVVMLTGHASIDSAVEATKLGAFDFLEKPADFDKLIDVLKRAYEARLRKKFEADKKRMEELEVLSMGSSPLAILKSLVQLDDDEK
jgi:DNA-binding NtrC family response regulator